SGMPIAADCVYGEKHWWGTSSVAPCTKCQERIDESQKIPQEEIRKFLKGIRSIIEANNTQDPRLIKLPARFASFAFCNKILQDYLTTGYCSLDPLAGQKGQSPYSIIRRGNLRKKIDDLLGLTSTQSTALAD